MTSSRCSVVVGEDGAELELVEEPDEGLATDSPLVHALKTYNDLLALAASDEATGPAIAKPVAQTTPPGKATVAASLLPAPSQRKRPPMPTADLWLRSPPPTTLLPSSRPRATLPTPHAGRMRVTIPPPIVRAQGTPPVGTRTKPLPVVGRAPRPTEKRVKIPPLADRANETTPVAASCAEPTPSVVPASCAEPTPSAGPVPVAVEEVDVLPRVTLDVPPPLTLDVTPPLALDVRSSSKTRSSHRRRRFVIAASTIGAAGIALAILAFGGRADDRAARPVGSEAILVMTSPPVIATATPASINSDVAARELPAAEPVALPAVPRELPAAVPTAAREVPAAEPVALPAAEPVAEVPGAEPVVAPSEGTTLAREPRAPKRAHARRPSNTTKAAISVASSTCDASEQPRRAASSEDLDAPFPE